jgi:AcrR family transcriptional regulator
MTDTSELSRADATRARLLDAAIAAFAEKGSHGTTTRDVATAAGMSPAALYVHHRSKEELLYLISRSGHEDTLRLVQQPITFSDDPATARYAQDLVVEWLVDPGDLEAVPELRTYAEADNGYAEELLVRLLFHQGDKQAATELRARAEAGNSDAAILLSACSSNEAIINLSRSCRRSPTPVTATRARGSSSCWPAKQRLVSTPRGRAVRDRPHPPDRARRGGRHRRTRRCSSENRATTVPAARYPSRRWGGADQFEVKSAGVVFDD